MRYTGEVSGAMLREAGVEYVIVGHSERRTLFGETDVTVGRKITAAFAAGLCPIACIGETLDQRERQETFDVLDRQIKIGLDGLHQSASRSSSSRTSRCGRLARAGTRRRRRRPRRTHTSASGCASGSGQDSAELCHVIYGGSVKPDNVADLASQPDIDGALVGGASLDVRSFLDIVVRSRQAARTRQAQSAQAGAV